jgi:hypothetical protein
VLPFSAALERIARRERKKRRSIIYAAAFFAAKRLAQTYVL